MWGLMIKAKILSLIFTILLCFSAFAGQQQGAGEPTAVAATCDTTNVIDWFRIEDFTYNGDCTGEDAPLSCCTAEDAGTCDLVANDVDFTLAEGAVVNSTSGKVGTNGLTLGTTYDNALLAAVSGTMDDEMRIGFWLNPVTWTDGRIIFKFYYFSGTDEVFLKLNGADGAGTRELELTWEDSNNVRTSLITSTADLSTNTMYWVEVAWKTADNHRAIYIDGVEPSYSGGHDAEIASFQSAVLWQRWGDDSGGAQNTLIDQIIHSTDSTDNLLPCSEVTEYAP